MKKTVNDIQLDFLLGGRSESPGLRASGFCADKNFAVLKRDHISGTCDAQELLMERRHPPIRDQENADLRQIFYDAGFVRRNLQAFSQRVFREFI